MLLQFLLLTIIPILLSYEYPSAGQLVILRAYGMFDVLSIQAYHITLHQELTYFLGRGSRFLFCFTGLSRLSQSCLD